MSSSADYALSIIIPAYNEAGLIEDSLAQVNRFIKNQTYSVEVLIVDDHSTDRTKDVVQSYIKDKPSFRYLENDQPKGKGGAVKTGMANAHGQIRLFSDADMSTPIDEVNKLMPLMDEFDIVIGSRRVNGAQLEKRQPLFREAMGRIYSLIVRGFVVSGFLDTQCGFKMFSSMSAESLFPLQTIHGFGFDVEILYLARKKFNYRVKEHPVRWIDCPKSHVNLMVHPLEMFFDLIRIAFNWKSGNYSSSNL